MDLKELGKKGEDLAVIKLKEIGYEILERNFFINHNEIDIVAKDGDELVFIEVKTRSVQTPGEPEDSLTEKKKIQFRKAAEGYLFVKNIENQVCRFDVIAIILDGEKEVYYKHYKDTISYDK